MSPFRRIVLAAFLLLLLFGCTEEPPPPAEVPAAQKVAVAPPMGDAPPPAPEETPAAQYVYEPSGRRDPFEVPLETKKAANPQEMLTPLQTFDLSQLRLIGVIVGKGQPTAMVLAPDGKSYILKKGVKVGRNGGVVVDIKPETVLVKEKYYEFSGEIRSSIQEIQLPKREGV